MVQEVGTTAVREDGELFSRYARSGDREALAEIARRRWPEAFRIALRVLGDAAAAEDAAQEAFVGLVRSARSFDPKQAFGPWFRAVVLNAARMQARSRARRVRIEDAAARGRPVTGVDPEPVLDREVHEKLLELPLELRFPVVLHFFEGLSQEEIGATLACAKTTARERIHRGLEQLRASFASAGVACSSVELERMLAKSAQVPVGPPAVPSVAALETSATKLVLPGLSVKAAAAAAVVACALGGGWACSRFFLEPEPRTALAHASPTTRASLAAPVEIANATSPPRTADPEPRVEEARADRAPAGPVPGEVAEPADASSVPLASPARVTELLGEELRGERRPSPYPWGEMLPSEGERKIRAQKVSFNFPESPLDEVLEFLHDITGLVIEIDPDLAPGLAGQAVTIRVRDLLLSHALALIASQLDVSGRSPSFVVDGDRIRLVAERDDRSVRGTRAYVEAALGCGPDGSDWRKEIEGKLQTTKLEFPSADAPLGELVDAFRDFTGLNLVPARGVDRNLAVQVPPSEQSALEALEALAKAAKLRWALRDGVIVLEPEQDRGAPWNDIARLQKRRVTFDLRGANVEDLISTLEKLGAAAVAAPEAWSSSGTFSFSAVDEPLGEVVARLSSATPLRVWIAPSLRRGEDGVIAVTGRVPAVADALDATTPPSWTGVATQLAELRAKLARRLGARGAARASEHVAPAELSRAEHEAWEAIGDVIKLATLARNRDRLPDVAADIVRVVEELVADLAKQRAALSASERANEPPAESERGQREDHATELARLSLRVRKTEARLRSFGFGLDDPVASARKAVQDARAEKERLEAGGRIDLAPGK